MKANIFSFDSLLLASAIALSLGFAAAPAGATVVYSGAWQSNESPNGNYIFQVTDTGSEFNYSLTVNPWNAEALGLFIDLGSVVMPDVVSLTNVSPVGQVTLFGKDTSSDDCGTGCNLEGLALPALGGGDWELVFRLGNVGFDSIQTFSWTTSDFGLTESAFGVVAIRAQQLCSRGTLVSGDTGCDGSDKVWAVPNGGGTPPLQIPEPGVMMLLGAGLMGLGLARRRKYA